MQLLIAEVSNINFFDGCLSSNLVGFFTGDFYIQKVFTFWGILLWGILLAMNVKMSLSFDSNTFCRKCNDAIYSAIMRNKEYLFSHCTVLMYVYM